MRYLVVIFLGIGSLCLAQAVPGPTLPPPVSKILSGYQGHFNVTSTATIASGSTTSSTLTLRGFELTGIVVPSAFTGTSLTFMASVDCTNFSLLKNSYGATTVTYTAAPNLFLAVNPADFAGVNCLQIVSGSTEGALRTLNISTRGL